MILLQPCTITPRDVWYGVYHIARYCKSKHPIDRNFYIQSYCEMIEIKYNIDADYLMETMGKYSLSIT